MLAKVTDSIQDLYGLLILYYSLHYASMTYCILCNLQCEIFIIVTKISHISTEHQEKRNDNFLVEIVFLKMSLCFHIWNFHKPPLILTATALDLFFFFLVDIQQYK